MYLSGKALKLFAATLVITSQIGSAATVEGTGSNTNQAAQKLSAAETSGLPFLKIVHDAEGVHQEIFQLHAENPDQAAQIEKFLDAQEKEVVKEHGQLGAVNFDGGLESGPYSEAGIKIPAEFASENISIPGELKENLKKKFEPFKDFDPRPWKWQASSQVGRENRLNATLTLIRTSGILVTTSLVAVTTTHVPLGAALPFSTAIALASGSAQFFNMIMPYNRENLSFSKKLAMWYATEVSFTLISQSMMYATNLWTDYFSHHMYFDLLPYKQILVTSAFALASQGLFDFADFTLYARNLISRNTFNTLTLFVSYASVALATSRSYGWSDANIFFGVFMGSAAVYSGAVYFKIPEKIAFAAKKSKLIDRCQSSMRELLRVKRK